MTRRRQTVFLTPPQATIANTHQTLSPLSDLLRLGDAGLKALLNDWLEGVYTAATSTRRWLPRSKLTHGEVIMTREGHAVSQSRWPSMRRLGTGRMLAPCAEIENLERQSKAQALIAEEARGAMVRAEAAYTDASQRPRHRASRSGRRADPGASTQVELLRLSQQAEQTSTRRAQLDSELGEVDAQVEELNERRATGEAKFEELDMQWRRRKSTTRNSTRR